MSSSDTSDSSSDTDDNCFDTDCSVCAFYCDCKKSYGNCYGCNCVLPFTKDPKLCQSCRLADERKELRPSWVLDPSHKISPKEWETGEVECGACNKVSKDQSAYEAHLCPVISMVVNRQLNETYVGTNVPPSIVEACAINWTGHEYKFFKCMICDTKDSKTISWETAHILERGKKRVACLDCLFDSADKKMIEKMAKEDPFTDINPGAEEPGSPKKPKLDY